MAAPVVAAVWVLVETPSGAGLTRISPDDNLTARVAGVPPCARDVAVGGGAVWLACERCPEFKAGVAWYGPLKAGPYPRTPPIDLVKDLKAPVLGLYGGQDKGIPAADIEAMRAAIKAAGKKAEIVVYPDAQHGFLADYRPSYNAEASAEGWKRMLAFFKANGVA